MKITNLGQIENKLTFKDLISGDFFKDGGEILIKIDDNIDQDGSCVNCYEITTNSFYKFNGNYQVKKVEIEEIIYKEVV